MDEHNRVTCPRGGIARGGRLHAHAAHLIAGEFAAPRPFALVVMDSNGEPFTACGLIGDGDLTEAARAAMCAALDELREYIEHGPR